MAKRPYRLAAAATLALCFSVVDCGGGTTINQSGFYRRDQDATVYKYDKASDSFCVVANVAQMDTFGGFQQVQLVPAGADILGSHPAPRCLWPDGTYRNVNATTTYRVTGSVACRVAGRPANVIVLPSDENVLSGRSFSGPCSAAASR